MLAYEDSQVIPRLIIRRIEKLSVDKTPKHIPKIYLRIFSDLGITCLS